MQKIYIIGSPGSGKGLLRTLLDGHKQIITCPFQNTGLEFVSKKFIDFIKKKKSYDWDNFLKKTTKKFIEIVHDNNVYKTTLGNILCYYLDNDSIKQYLDQCINKSTYIASSQSNISCFDFDLDFTELLNTFLNLLKKTKRLTIEELQNLYYKSYIKTWKNKYPTTSNNINFVLSNNVTFEEIEDILKFNKNKKILVVLRDPISVSFTNAEREIHKNNKFNKNSKFSKFFFNYYDFHLFSEKKINDIKCFFKKIRKITKNEDDILLIWFEDLIRNTEKTMNNIAKFINIEKDKILYYATINTIPIESNNVNIVKKIDEDPYNKLNDNQIKILKYLYKDIYPKEKCSIDLKIIINIIKYKFLYKFIWKNKYKLF